MSESNGSKIIAASRVPVLLPLVFGQAFTYRVPDGMQLETGDYVRVPFGRKSVWGVVWDEAAHTVDERKLKDIEMLAAHLPPMSEAMRRFIAWVSWYTLAPLGQVLKMALPVPEALEPPRTEECYRKMLPTPDGFKLTPARLRILAYLSDAEARTASDIRQHARVSPAVLREAIRAGGIAMIGEKGLPTPLQYGAVRRDPFSLQGEGQGEDLSCGESPLLNPLPEGRGDPVSWPGSQENVVIREPEIFADIPVAVQLSPEQQAAVAALAAKCGAGFSVTLLDGVTGSGKTEVYFDTIARCLAAGRQALVLLPEIALSVQWLARFKARFGFAPDLWHSGVTPASRRDSWRGVAEGRARVVVGARSALFLPYAKLGLLIVDEEHDASYKQEEGVIYHARDMAVARAAREKIPVLLVSATPSLETEQNIALGRYTRLHLASRYAEASLPQIKLIDMREQKLGPGQWLSAPLKAALAATLARGEQAMLFMNRRGYAPLMLCRACGHRIHCPHCAAFLVLHRARGRLLCHHCGYESRPPKACPDCKSEDALTAYGPGVERIAEEVRGFLPQASIAVMTSDLVDTPAKAEALITAMMRGETDILVGTQMIAKGHHFAGLAFVGVVDADMGLAGGDLRAGERTYQLLHQLAGRAGREKTKGEVWLQTYLPDHPVMQALVAWDRDRFMALESNMRAHARMPPFGKLAAVIVEGSDEAQVAAQARLLVRHAQNDGPRYAEHASPLVLGPAPAPLTLLRGKYRYRILIKAARGFPLQEWLAGVMALTKTPAALRVKIDVEPYSFL